ncbi:ATP-dependent nuclease [Ruoffia sp. FAM 20858]|uniref:ATP-dependent nuclease n=1 Tax=Ruoffia sp. FAM 20858 TaxID=3259516 RepID=UPI0038839876
MDNVLNWQENSEISNAQSFFEKISILPNMPPMNSLLNSVMLGYDEQHLSSQGLGYRNLILLLVMINSLLNYSETFYSLLVIEEPEAHISHSNHQILKSYLTSVSKSKESVQILYSTHDVNFINKLNLNSLVLFYDGRAISLKEELNKGEKDYLSRNPNLDLFKLFYSTKCILVEGITEEIFLKTYLHNLENTINDIEVISFHKGFTNIIDIWLKLYEGSDNKLGIVRDFDDEPNARDNHHKYNGYKNICVDTTSYYTLEDEIVNTDDNFNLLNTYFQNEFKWDKFDTAEELSEFWKKQKADTMIEFTRDLNTDKLKGFALPRHIETVLEFMDIDVNGG